MTEIRRRGVDGEFVLTEDHLSAVQQLEQRIARLREALRAVAQRKLKDETFCWCGMGYSVDDTHYPFCKKARAALKENE